MEFNRLKLSQLNFHDANFDRAKFSNCSFKHNDLGQAKIRFSSFTGSYLDLAESSSVSFVGSYFNSVEFARAKPSLFGSPLFFHSHFFYCTFKDCDLELEKFKYCELYEVVFNDCHIQSRELATLTGTNLTFSNSILENVDLSEIEGLNQKIIDEIYFADIAVRIPYDLKRPLHWPLLELSRDQFTEVLRKWKKQIK